MTSSSSSSLSASSTTLAMRINSNSVNSGSASSSGHMNYYYWPSSASSNANVTTASQLNSILSSKLFSSECNYSNYNEPLTINVVNSNPSASLLSSSSSLTSAQHQSWSPFSLPSISPYCSNSSGSSCFQFSFNQQQQQQMLYDCYNAWGNGDYESAVSSGQSRWSKPTYSSVVGSKKHQSYHQYHQNQGQGQTYNRQQPPQQQHHHHQQQSSPIDIKGAQSSNNDNNINNNNNNNKRLPKRSEQVDMSELLKIAALNKANGGRPKSCTFCRSNGECEEIYTSHSLKDATDKITCPILMLYSCPICGAAGEKTHTKKYCPVLQKNIRNEMLNKLMSKPAASTIASAATNQNATNSN